MKELYKMDAHELGPIAKAKVIFFLSLQFFTLAAFAQTPPVNLVPNSSFEEHIGCPTKITGGEVALATHWIMPTKGTTDYYHPCGDPYWGVPENCAGSYQKPLTGKAYGGFMLWSQGAISNKNYREYIEVKLDAPLKANQKYTVSFYLSLLNECAYATDAIAALFTVQEVRDTSTDKLLTTATKPQVNNLTGQFLADTLQWMAITGNFVAKGGEQFLTIGNFKSDSLTSTKKIKQGVGKTYYYIDDVSVIEDTASVGIPNLAIQSQVAHCYYNANNELLTIDYPADLGLADIAIYDCTGRICYSLQAQSASRQLAMANWPSGIYIIKLTTPNNTFIQKISIDH